MIASSNGKCETTMSLIYRWILTAGCALIVLQGCGSNRAADPEQDSPVEDGIRTGIFLDNPVAGIGYTSGSLSCLTTSLGGFKYEQTRIVLFFIGDIVLRETPVTGVITPIDFVPDNRCISTSGHEFGTVSSERARPNLDSVVHTTAPDVFAISLIAPYS